MFADLVSIFVAVFFTVTSLSRARDLDVRRSIQVLYVGSLLLAVSWFLVVSL